MLNPLLIKTLLTVVRTGNFRGAAETLGLSQPAVSQHIRRLEKELDVTLIRRDRKGCEPTPAALAFLPGAERALKMLERAEAALKPDQLRIGAGSNIGIYILQPLLKTFLDAHPGLDVSLVVEGNPAIAERLENGELDLALMEWWDGRPGFESVRWRRESLVLIVPPGHPLSRRSSIAKGDLSGAPMLGGEPGTGTGRLLQACFGPGAAPVVSMRLGSTEAVKQAVAAGLGVSLVLETAVRREAAAGVLCAIPFSDPAPAKDLYAVWPTLAAHRLPREFVRHLAGSPVPSALC